MKPVSGVKRLETTDLVQAPTWFCLKTVVLFGHFLLNSAIIATFHVFNHLRNNCFA